MRLAVRLCCHWCARACARATWHGLPTLAVCLWCSRRRSATTPSAASAARAPASARRQRSPLLRVFFAPTQDGALHAPATPPASSPGNTLVLSSAHVYTLHPPAACPAACSPRAAGGASGGGLGRFQPPSALQGRQADPRVRHILRAGDAPSLCCCIAKRNSVRRAAPARFLRRAQGTGIRHWRRHSTIF